MENLMGPASLLLGCLLLWHDFGGWDFFHCKSINQGTKKSETKNFKNAGKLGTNDYVYIYIETALLHLTKVINTTERFEVAYLP